MSDCSLAGISGEVTSGICSQAEQNSQPALSTAESVEQPTGDSFDLTTVPRQVKTVTASPAAKATDSSLSTAGNRQDGAVKSEDSANQSVQSTGGQQNSAKEFIPDSTSTKDLTKKAVERKVCTFFARSGWCRYGERCRYLHAKRTQLEPEHVSSKKEAAVPDVAKPTSSGTDDQTPSRSTCRFYARSGFCSYGYRCRFAHVRTEIEHKRKSEVSLPADQSAGTREDDDDDHDDTLTSAASQISLEEDQQERLEDRKRSKRTKPTNQKRCRFYALGHCRLGRRCWYLHAEKQQTTEGNDDAESEKVVEEPDTTPKEDNGGWQPARRQTGPVTSRLLAEFKDGDAAKMRETEIIQLKKRFPGDKLDIITDSDNPSYRFTLKPTDPDWPYDLKDFEVAVIFPLDYPVSPLQLSLPEDQVLPPTILRHISDAVLEWLEARFATNQLSGRVELMVRPFLRWFDRSIMRLFTEGARKYKKEVYAKAAGFEFISYASKADDKKKEEQAGEEEAPSHYKEEFINHEMDENRGEDEEEDDEEEDDEEDGEDDDDDEEAEEDDESRSGEREGKRQQDESSPAASPANPSKFVSPTENRRGTEIRFPRMEMSESAATLSCEKIKIRIQCSRCRDQSDMTVAPGLAMVLGCSKCKNQQAVGYRPCVMHQFSSIMGFLDVTGCVAMDLIIFECKFVVSCLECSTNNKIQGMQYGQDRLVWCSNCHEKMSIRLDTARLQRLVASVPQGKTELVAVKKEKRAKDPTIKEGFPLPANGTCKHYKKSFRWLRFPCCGKVYPCDECHDLEEMDHDMKFATRMICGFCSKEQPYSADKPCLSCGSNVTKSRTTHWEGGTGCRNKNKMSRNDSKKYSNLSKTISKHAKKVEEFQKGKKKK